MVLSLCRSNLAPNAQQPESQTVMPPTDIPSTEPDQILLQTGQLAALLKERDTQHLLPVFVGSEAMFEQAHLPGAVHIAPSALVCGVAPASGKIPDRDELEQVFANIGLTGQTTVIAYDDEGGGWAGRLLWTLDVLGHQRYHYLDGGLLAWLEDQRSIEQGRGQVPQPSAYHAKIDRQQLVDVEQLKALLASQSIDVWDARSAAEFSGDKVLAARGGHMPGASNLDWLELMDRGNALRLKPLTAIRATLAERGISGDKPIVTHCHSHHRSGLTYLVGKLLGFNIRGYDGSWSEWGNRADTPIESGQTND